MRVQSEIRPSNVLFVVLALIGSVLLGSTATPEPAAAFDIHSEGCGNDTTRSPSWQGTEWNLSWNPPVGGGPPGNYLLKDPFYWGHLQWIWEAKAFNGSPALNPGDSFAMDFVPGWKIGGSGAVTVCGAQNPLYYVVGGAKIAFNVDNLASLRNNTQARNQGFSAHEWGHRWGLGHSGSGDSFGGGAPTMGTCMTSAQTNQRINLSQDDVAAAAYLTEGGTWNAVTANNSFETGVHWWGRNIATLTQVSGGVDGSPYAGQIGPSTNPAARIWSTTRVTDLNASGADGRVNGDRYNARINYRDVYAANSGSIAMLVRVRPVTYVDGSNLSCNFYGDNKNSIESIGSWVDTTVYCSPTGSWGFCTSTTKTAPHPSAYQPVYDRPDAADAQLHVYNRTFYPGGSPAALNVDRTRIRWDF